MFKSLAQPGGDVGGNNYKLDLMDILKGAADFEINVSAWIAFECIATLMSLFPFVAVRIFWAVVE